MPAPKLSVRINEDHLRQLCCDKLGFKSVPRIEIITRGHQRRHYGTYDPLRNIITIYVNLSEQAGDRLSAVNSQVLHTFLHELRHAWQHRNWTSEHEMRDDRRNYSEQRRERDANEWAQTHAAEHRALIRVSRITRPPAGFARLSTHSRRGL